VNENRCKIGDMLFAVALSLTSVVFSLVVLVLCFDVQHAGGLGIGCYDPDELEPLVARPGTERPIMKMALDVLIASNRDAA